MADRLGQKLGSYRLIRLVGQGGFAEVYLGEHIYLNSLAAIKVLHTRLAHEDLEKFLSEARTLANLVHPHIVRVLDFGVENETPFLVMDYAPNGTLRQRYPRGSILPLSTIVGYVLQVADALQYAHNVKVIHRDVKPENMLIGRNNEILLSDFGIAIVAQSSRYSVSNELAGTIAYMAPEQIQSHPRPASDQYALGIVVYEWLSGERPFSGSFPEIAAKQTMSPPPPLREKVPALPPIVEHVVLTALEKDPSKRFANVRAFANALVQASRETGFYSATLADENSLSGQGGLATLANQTEIAASRQSFQSSDRQELKTPILPLYNPDPTFPSTGISASEHATPPLKQRRLLSVIGVTLVALLVIGSFISWLAFSHRIPFTAGPNGTATPTPTATSVPTVYPNIAGNYKGPIHNTAADIYSNMTLSINQNQGNISGEFTVDPPLQGTGPFTGNILANDNFQFIVHSKVTTAPIFFWGTLQTDNSLSGGYCSVNPGTQCDSNYGGRGDWSATHT